MKISSEELEFRLDRETANGDVFQLLSKIHKLHTACASGDRPRFG